MLVAAAVLGAGLAPGLAAAGPTADDGPRIAAVRLDWHHSLASAIGSEAAGTLHVEVHNEGAAAARGRVVVTFDGRELPGVRLRLPPGRSGHVAMEVVAPSPSWGRHTVAVRYGTAERQAVSWNVPWLLVLTALLTAHLVLITCRDALREWIGRRVGATSTPSAA